MPPPPPPAPVVEQGGKPQVKGNFPANVVCFRCKGNHHVKDCQDGPKCFKSGKPNHMARDCKEPVPENIAAPRVCYKCGLPGHGAKDCKEHKEMTDAEPRADDVALPMDEEVQ